MPVIHVNLSVFPVAAVAMFAVVVGLVVSAHQSHPAKRGHDRLWQWVRSRDFWFDADLKRLRFRGRTRRHK